MEDRERETILSFSHSPADFGSSWPRTRYPLVVVLGFSDGQHELQELHDFDGTSCQRVVALVTVLHVQDDGHGESGGSAAAASPSTSAAASSTSAGGDGDRHNGGRDMDTHVMLTFVVTNANQKLRLQPYIPSGSPTEEEGKEEKVEEEKAETDEVHEEGKEGNQEILGRNCNKKMNNDEPGSSSPIPVSQAGLEPKVDSVGHFSHHVEDVPLASLDVSPSLPTSSTNALSNDSSQSTSLSSPAKEHASASKPPRRAEDCSVCLSLPVSVVTLPCRHAAVCRSCLHKLVDRRCPVCRSPIQTHFELDVFSLQPEE